MFLGAFAGNFRRSGLVPLFGNSSSVHGDIDSTVIRILYEWVLPILIQKPNRTFMHDNTSTHTAHIVQEFLDELQIEVMDWSARSQGLNPIGNFWTLLKNKTYELYPRRLDMQNNEEIKAYLINAAQVAWQQLNFSYLEHLLETMLNHVRAIIEADGWYTSC